MATSDVSHFVTEPEKQIPCVYDVDVAVAGGGVAGVIAALAAARHGAQTVLIDRFGSPGGNIGPGLFVGGSLTGYPSELLRRAFAGLPREFIETHAAHGGGAIPPYSQRHYLRDSSIASCVALKMLEESGVHLMLSAYAADPIMDGNQVCGLFVENKSGRQAVRAKVVVDDTGEADLARRARAPVLYPLPEIKERGRAMGLYFVLGGVDWAQYGAAGRSWRQEEGSGDDLEMGNQMYQDLLKKAGESGEYRSTKEVDDLCTLICFQFPLHEYDRDGFASGYVAVDQPHSIDPGDGTVISKMETHMRLFAFETCQFWKNRVPGFGDSYLLTIAPFLGSRGGPAIEGEYVMTEEDLLQGRRFEDVIYRYFSRERNWVDVPYRVMVPKKTDGLLAVGRSASARPASLLRSRLGLMQMGQAGGIAAALAAENGVPPRRLDVEELQWKLLDAGCYLGDQRRLRELGLIG